MNFLFSRRRLESRADRVVSADNAGRPHNLPAPIGLWPALRRLVARFRGRDDEEAEAVLTGRAECVGIAFQFANAESGSILGYDAVMYRDIGAEPVTLRLYANNDGAPGALLDITVPNLTILSATPAMYSFTSRQTPTLTVGAKYWLLATSGHSSNIGWNLATSGTANHVFTTDDGATFGGAIAGTTGAFRVNLKAPGTDSAPVLAPCPGPPRNVLREAGLISGGLGNGLGDSRRQRTLQPTG